MQLILAEGGRKKGECHPWGMTRAAKRGKKPEEESQGLLGSQEKRIESPLVQGGRVLEMKECQESQLGISLKLPTRAAIPGKLKEKKGDVWEQSFTKTRGGIVEEVKDGCMKTTVRKRNKALRKEH